MKMKTLTASDRNALIKLASSLPKGDNSRRVILAQLNPQLGMVREWAEYVYDVFLSRSLTKPSLYPVFPSMFRRLSPRIVKKYKDPLNKFFYAAHDDRKSYTTAEIANTLKVALHQGKNINGGDIDPAIIHSTKTALRNLFVEAAKYLDRSDTGAWSSGSIGPMSADPKPDPDKGWKRTLPPNLH